MQLPEGNLNLYLTTIGEPTCNQLRIVVTEGLLGDFEKVDLESNIFGEARPIIITDQSRSFELRWSNYVAYVVRDERFWAAEKEEPLFPHHLKRRFNSAFLRFVSETTFADDHYPGPLEHWAVNTLNHCVDVVSVGRPQVVPTKTII